MDFSKFITEQALILIPVLYILGLVLKNSSVKDKLIPIILLGIGVISSVALLGLNIQAVIQGVLVAGTAVFTNQLIKQTSKDE